MGIPNLGVRQLKVSDSQTIREYDIIPLVLVARNIIEPCVRLRMATFKSVVPKKVHSD